MPSDRSSTPGKCSPGMGRLIGSFYIYIYIIVNILFFAIWEMGGSRYVENAPTGFVSNFSGRQAMFWELLCVENFASEYWFLNIPAKNLPNVASPSQMAITNGFGPKLYPWKVSSKYGKVHSRSMSARFWVCKETPHSDNNLIAKTQT